jgi:hypothetical protein
MAKSPSRRRRFAPSPSHELLTFPVLIMLVAGIVVFGVFHYSLMLAVLSAVFVGFFGWLWWWRRSQAMTTPARKPARRRPAANKHRR